jgi:transcriptional regulator with XRE-family HTH domain
MSKAERPTETIAEAGRRLKAARHALGLSQEELAKAIGVERNALSNWETGQRLADVLAMARLYNEFNVTLEWIYCGTLAQMPYAIATKIRQKLAEASTPGKPSRRRPSVGIEEAGSKSRPDCLSEDGDVSLGEMAAAD